MGRTYLKPVDLACRRLLYARVQVQTENSFLVIERGHKARAYMLQLPSRYFIYRSQRSQPVRVVE